MKKAVIAIHGGAGVMTRARLSSTQANEFIQSLSHIVACGQAVLATNGSALDAVTEAVSLLEECPLFNAGIGSVFTHAGTHEMDACIMDGNTLKIGAVAGVHHIRNPVLTARLVLERSPHVLLIAKGAEDFAQRCGQDLVSPEFFPLPGRYQQLKKAMKEHLTETDDVKQDGYKWEGVGAVALDLSGNLAAATSTGGLTNRVGDSSLPGAGCYANNANVAVVCTGTEGVFIRTLAAYDIAALMEYAGLSLHQATERVVMEKIPILGGSGGVIAIDNQGNIAMPFNSEGMYRGYGYVGDAPSVGIYRDRNY